MVGLFSGISGNPPSNLQMSRKPRMNVVIINFDRETDPGERIGDNLGGWMKKLRDTISLNMSNLDDRNTSKNFMPSKYKNPM